ncbi:hypothetical protein B0J18DRAFT_408620 [Chaetomium sp. MPI-SDFR-AT-0129]|nr:hypothetical protein B0J18DRAFT_408620 [Chaetomium sp. MPI-SDFR-AT-0129]
MGAIKGVSSILNRLRPQTHVNTLDSNRGCPPIALQTNDSRPLDGPSPSKRRKTLTDHSTRGPNEEISEIEHDQVSWREPQGSQASLAHSVSPGIPEYQTVEAAGKGAGRSNRRSRRPKPATSLATTGSETGPGPSRQLEEDIESFDELAPAPRPSKDRQRTARLIATGRTTLDISISDPADAHILRGATSRPSANRFRNSTNHANKRSAISANDQRDELIEVDGDDGDEGDGRAASDPTGGSVTEDPKQKPSSAKKVTVADSTGAVIYGAGWGAQGSRDLWRTDREVFSAAENGGMIRGGMVIKFTETSGAMMVANWAQEHLPLTKVVELSREKLCDIWSRALKTVTDRYPELSAALEQRAHNSPETISTNQRRNLQSESEVTEERENLQGAVATVSRTPIWQQMQVSPNNSTDPLAQGNDVKGGPVQEPARGSRSLRSTQRAAGNADVEESASHSRPHHRWSYANRDWATDWKMPLMVRRTTVDKDDIPRLDEGECLNDNIIGYGLRYTIEALSQDDADLPKRVYMHNSFFYEKLKAPRGEINYDGVKNWTAKVDLLSYDFIVVPVNENYHWWVAIICNPGRLDPDVRKDADKSDGSPTATKDPKGLPASDDVEMPDAPEPRSSQSRQSPGPDDLPPMVKSDLIDLVADTNDVGNNVGNNVGSSPSRARSRKSRKSKGPPPRIYDPKDPRIITLDSLGSAHPLAVGHLKKYLLAEFEDKRNKVITDIPQQIGMKAVNIPVQNNLCDCGVYLLGYIHEFLRNPDGFVRELLKREKLEWDFNPSGLRITWRDIILREQQEYQKEQLRLRAKKKRPRTTEVSQTPKPETGPSQPQPAVGPSKGSNGVGMNGPDSTSAQPGMPQDGKGKSLPSVPASVSAHPSPNSPRPRHRGELPDPETPLPSKEVENSRPLAASKAALPSAESPEIVELRSISKRPQTVYISQDMDYTKGYLSLKDKNRNGHDHDDDDDDDDTPQFIGQLPVSSSPSPLERASAAYDPGKMKPGIGVQPSSFYAASRTAGPSARPKSSSSFRSKHNDYSPPVAATNTPSAATRRAHQQAQPQSHSRPQQQPPSRTPGPVRTKNRSYAESLIKTPSTYAQQQKQNQNHPVQQTPAQKHAQMQDEVRARARERLSAKKSSSSHGKRGLGQTQAQAQTPRGQEPQSHQQQHTTGRFVVDDIDDDEELSDGLLYDDNDDGTVVYQKITFTPTPSPPDRRAAATEDDLDAVVETAEVVRAEVLRDDSPIEADGE